MFADLIGREIDRYKIVEKIGSGGMATVYKAYDTRLERDVAIKVIRRDAFHPDETGVLLKRFEREAKSLGRLSHPNIVGVIDFGEFEGAPYLVMEYLSGGTLKDRLGKPSPWREAVRMILPMKDTEHLLGFVALTSKVAGYRYSPEDMNLLGVLSNQAALEPFGPGRDHP